MKTTLNKIRQHSPCKSGWRTLLTNLGKTKADDEPVSIAFILESNGLDDALWCLRAVDGYPREMRLYAVDCARMVQHLMTDRRSLDALAAAERHADGLATDVELDAARAAARAAWAAAAWAARGTARDAEWAAARDAAWAARDAARAARDAARDAAGGTARDAAGAAWAAAWAARDAARDAQANLLALMCAEIEQRELEK